MGGVIPDEIIEEIREQADIVEVLSDHLTLKKAGRNYKGLCPFHQEKTPSFMVSPEKQLFHCFGCGIGGNVFTFLMKYEQISFAEAARSLAQRYGVRIPEGKTSVEDQRRERLLNINALALDFYVNLLREDKGGKNARDYLTQRGIERGVWEDYRIGYAPPRWDALVTHFKKKGLNAKEVEALGLIIPKKGGWYDRFRDRIIFPIFDLRDRVIGFGGRVLDETKEPKYLNSPDSFLYKKGANFYGINVARKYIRKEDEKVFIVEGYFDLLSMAQQGIKNVVATLGTALTPEQVRFARRFGKEFFLLFDPDEAGKKAALRGLNLFVQEDIFPMVIPLPDGLDPDSYFQQGGSRQALLERAVPGVEYAMETLMYGCDLGTVEGKAKVIKTVLPFLLQIKDGVSRDLYLKRLAEKMGVKEVEIRDAAFAMRNVRKHGAEREPATTMYTSTEKKLVQMMIQYPEFIPRVAEEGVVEGFKDRNLRFIGELTIHDFQHHGGLSLDRLVPQLGERGLSEMTFALAFQGEELDESMAERIVVDCLRNIKLNVLKRQREGINKKIKEAEVQGDEALGTSLSLRWEALNSQINKLQKEGLKGSY
jgi:DNA primase